MVEKSMDLQFSQRRFGFESLGTALEWLLNLNVSNLEDGEIGLVWLDEQ